MNGNAPSLPLSFLNASPYHRSFIGAHARVTKHLSVTIRSTRNATEKIHFVYCGFEVVGTIHYEYRTLTLILYHRDVEFSDQKVWSDFLKQHGSDCGYGCNINDRVILIRSI